MYQWTHNDMDVLVAQSGATSPPIDPVGVALVLFIESAGFDPQNPGPSGANVAGLNQMSSANLANLGLSRDAWLAMTAAEQLPIIFRFWRSLAASFNHGRFPRDPAHLLAVNFLPGAYLNSGADTNDQAVLCGKNGPLAWAYAPNVYYDPDGTGAITVATIARRQSQVAQSGNARWDRLAADVAAAVARAHGGGGGGASGGGGSSGGYGPPMTAPTTPPATPTQATGGGGGPVLAALALIIAFRVGARL